LISALGSTQQPAYFNDLILDTCWKSLVVAKAEEMASSCASIKK
jgi:hypothetical protein